MRSSSAWRPRSPCGAPRAPPRRRQHALDIDRSPAIHIIPRPSRGFPMATATLPRSAQILTGPNRPTIAQVRVLRRIAIQDVEEHRKLVAAMQDGLGGLKEDIKVRKAVLAFALGHFSDAEEALVGGDAYNQALLGLIYHELG